MGLYYIPCAGILSLSVLLQTKLGDKPPFHGSLSKILATGTWTEAQLWWCWRWSRSPVGGALPLNYDPEGPPPAKTRDQPASCLMLLNLKAASSVLDWCHLRTVFNHFQGLLPGSRSLRYPKSRYYVILSKNGAWYISVFLSTRTFGNEISGKVNWKTW